MDLQTLLGKQIPALAGIDDPGLEVLAAQAQTVRMAPGNFVFRAGDACNSYLVLLEGEIRVQLVSTEGREVTLYRIGPGGSCVLTTSCLMGGEIYPAEAIAVSAVTAIAVPRGAFQSMLETSRRFRQFVFDGFSVRLSSVIKKIQHLVFTPIDVRLASALLEAGVTPTARITHQELSVELGTAREVISRHLKRFEKEGLVRLGRGKLEVVDAPRLRRLADLDLCD